MSTPETPAPRSGMRRSHQVALVLLGTAGVVGVATVWDAWRHSSPSTPVVLPEAPATPIATDRVYANNQYIPGVGYYHAPYHAWFPHPFNHHDPARGYFAGGLWQTVPWAMALTQSQPNSSAVTSALAAQRRQQEVQRPPTRTSGFSTGGYRGTGFSSPRPSGMPSAPKPSIFRGGFGSSSHHGVS